MLFEEDIIIDTSTGFVTQTDETYGMFETKEEFIGFLYPWFKDICTKLECYDEMLYSWGDRAKNNGGNYFVHGISVMFYFKNQYFNGPFSFLLVPAETPKEMSVAFCRIYTPEKIYENLKTYYEFGITEYADRPGQMIMNRREFDMDNTARRFISDFKKVRDFLCAKFGFKI